MPRPKSVETHQKVRRLREHEAGMGIHHTQQGHQRGVDAVKRLFEANNEGKRFDEHLELKHLQTDNFEDAYISAALEEQVKAAKKTLGLPEDHKFSDDPDVQQRDENKALLMYKGLTRDVLERAYKDFLGSIRSIRDFYDASAFERFLKESKAYKETVEKAENELDALAFAHLKKEDAPEILKYTGTDKHLDADVIRKQHLPGLMSLVDVYETKREAGEEFTIDDAVNFAQQLQLGHALKGDALKRLEESVKANKKVSARYNKDFAEPEN